MKPQNIVAVALWTAILTTILIAPLFASSEEEVPMHEPTHRQQVYLHALQFCESSGRTDIKIMDSNNKHSYGGLMFQMSTFLSQGKKYELIAGSTTAVQGEKMIYDIELQEAIAHRMLEDGGERNWYTCTKKLGKYPTD